MSVCNCIKKDTRHPKYYGYNLHWSFSNSKLAPEGIISFNLPALRSQTGFTVCPQAGICAAICYARQGHYLMSKVSQPRECNLQYLLTHSMEDFVAIAVADLYRLHPSWQRVRIHDSGDFFTEPYLDAWLRIAESCPHLEFYGYTKQIQLRHTKVLPANLHLIQSCGGKQDADIDYTQAHSRIFATSDQLFDAGYVDASHSDKPAYTREIKLGLCYHGTKLLTSAQKTQLGE